MRRAKIMPQQALKIYKYGQQNITISLKCKQIDVLTPKLKNHIQLLKKHAAQQRYCSLASNQAGNNIYSIFVCLMKQYLKPWQWSGYQNIDPSMYETIINPQLHSFSQIMEYRYEECCSLVGFKYRVKRPYNIQVKYRDERMNQQIRQLKGFHARVWQHEMSHLDGKLISDFSECAGEIQLTDDFKELPNEIELNHRREKYQLYTNQNLSAKKLPDQFIDSFKKDLEVDEKVSQKVQKKRGKRK